MSEGRRTNGNQIVLEQKDVDCIKQVRCIRMAVSVANGSWLLAARVHDRVFVVRSEYGVGRLVPLRESMSCLACLLENAFANHIEHSKQISELYPA